MNIVLEDKHYIRLTIQTQENLLNVPPDYASYPFLTSLSFHFLIWEREINGLSSFGIATGYVMDGQGSIPDRGEIFSLFTGSRPSLEPTQPPIQFVPCIQRLRRVADDSLPSTGDLKNGGAIFPLPHTSTWYSA
jgi:hypothetical protein